MTTVQEPQGIQAEVTCTNKYCPGNHYSQEGARELCPTCLDRYQKDFFCVYCQQVYFESTDDGKNWIECDVCNGWVHEQCANVSFSKNPARDQPFSFSCIKCKKLNDTVKEGGVGLRRTNTRQPAKANKKIEVGGLSSLGFQMALLPEEIAEDVKKTQEHLLKM